MLQVVAPALTAEDHWTGEPLWNVRLAAAGTLLPSFPRYYRETEEKVNAILRSLLPEHVFESQQHQAQKVFEAMRESWASLDGLRFSEKLQALYVRPFPGHTIGPWENATEIQRSRKPPESLARAQVTRLPDGKSVALMREHAAALLVPIEDEPDDGSIEVDIDAVPAY